MNDKTQGEHEKVRLSGFSAILLIARDCFYADVAVRRYLRHARENSNPPRTDRAVARLKRVASTAPGNAAIDVTAAEERGIQVVGTAYRSTPTIEMTWALILVSVRNVVSECNSVRSGGWQVGVGEELERRWASWGSGAWEALSLGSVRPLEGSWSLGVKI
jgi:phosphoglycerate dehydrogenase-like enzyme